MTSSALAPGAVAPGYPGLHVPPARGPSITSSYKEMPLSRHAPQESHHHMPPSSAQQCIGIFVVPGSKVRLSQVAVSKYSDNPIPSGKA